MAEAAKQFQPEYGPELDEFRLLTEFDHIVAHMRPDGSVPEPVLEDELINLETAVYEIALPKGVATSIHRAEYIEDEEGKRRRMLMWMGKNIVRSALNGKLFHKSEAAHARVDVEVAEAEHTQDNLQPGIAQVFISPKMTEWDAPTQLAKAEHLHADDSLRVSYAVTNSQGVVIGRRLESLLVRDVPIEAWVAMLRDPNNMFGKAFDISDERSAVSVMELFRDLELPEEAITEGPITLVAAVQKYIKDNEAYDSVGHQLEGFRNDQELYKQQAELAAKQWLEFEIELAKSYKTGLANEKIKNFISALADQWDDEALQIISSHVLGEGQLVMTRQLTALLERAKRNVLTSTAAIATKNERVMAQLQPDRAQNLYNDIHSLQIMYANQLISEQEYIRQQAQLESRVAGQNIKGGGGCPDDAAANFRSQDDALPGSQSSGGEESSKKKLMSCPFCSAKVFGDPCATVLSCTDCWAMVVNGRVVSKGDGGSEAREARKKAEIARPAAKINDTELELAKQVDAVFEERELEVPITEASENQSHVSQATSYAKPLAQLALNN